MKTTKHLFTYLLCIVMYSSAFAQTERTIEVNGSAETEITPDIIKLSVILTEYEKDRKLVTLNDIETGFLKAINESGIADDKVVVSRVSSNAYNTKRKRKAFASKTYELTFSDQKGLLNFTSRLKNIDISNMYISQLSHTQMEEHRISVKKAALLAAKEKAKVLVEAVDAQLGEIINIKEDPAYDNSFAPRSMMSNVRLQYPESKGELEADEIGFKKIKLRFEIYARFRIE